MLPELTNMLSWWQWAALGAVPPAIVALYFLKLKRTPLEVPSTFLWRRSIEDLHVNSIWQRLRRNLLLWLQLLVVLLVMLAVLRPSWLGSTLSGGRYIFLVDNSASMSVADVDGPDGPMTRLDAAKQQVASLIKKMQPGDAAMIISFADVAQVQQAYTANEPQLLRRLDEIHPTSRTTSLREALDASAGLANPGTRSFDESDAAAADPMPARLFILSDGKFPDVDNFALDNLYKSEQTKPVFLPYGSRTTRNVAILALGAQHNDERPDEAQALVALENWADAAVEVEISLSVDGGPPDVKRRKLDARGSGSVVFDLDAARIRRAAVGSVLAARISEIRYADGKQTPDGLAVDNEAWAVVSPPRRAKVAVVSPGNLFLEKALATDRARQTADVRIHRPDVLAQPAFQKQAADGAFDLVIYDRCAPPVDDDPAHPLAKMPQANTLFIGRLPPLPAVWPPGAKVEQPRVIDAVRTHPLLQWVDMDGVAFAEATALTPPPSSGVRALVETNQGPVLAIGPRGGFEDAVLSAEIVGETDGQQFYKTNWWQRQSFPVFVGRVLAYLGHDESLLGGQSIRPGQSKSLRATAPVDSLTVVTPSGEHKTVRRSRLGVFHFTETLQPGVYAAREQGQVVQRFAVNLFSSPESDVRPRPPRDGGQPVIRIGHEEIAGTTGWEPERREGWKYLLALVLVVAAFEWYIYNRRVYL